MLTLKPPTHTADAGAGVYIHTFDPATRFQLDAPDWTLDGTGSTSGTPSFLEEMKPSSCGRRLTITPAGLNFVVLDSGVVIQTDEEGELVVWAPARPAQTKRVVALDGHMRLVRQGGRAGAIRGDSVLGLSLAPGK